MEVAANHAEHAIPNRLAARLPASPSLLLLIVAGASAGTALRSWLEAVFAPAPGAWPWVTFWINVLGSFALGVLLEALAGTGPDQGWRRRVRLGVGTGLLGGFTTYSTFSLEVVGLMRGGSAWLGLAYALLSVTVGIAAAFGGTRVARALVRVGRRPTVEGPSDD